MAGSSAANPHSASAAVRAKSPAVSMLGDKGTMPSFSHLPTLVLRPNVPQKAAGTRTEPEVSEPKASWQAPIHNDTGAPELEPPGTRCCWVSNGLTGTGQWGLVPKPPKANSTVWVLPQTWAPTFVRRSTKVPEVSNSFSAKGEPAKVSKPVTA